jgi:hypothetical protein
MDANTKTVRPEVAGEFSPYDAAAELPLGDDRWIVMQEHRPCHRRMLLYLLERLPALYARDCTLGELESESVQEDLTW